MQTHKVYKIEEDGSSTYLGEAEVTLPPPIELIMEFDVSALQALFIHPSEDKVACGARAIEE